MRRMTILGGVAAVAAALYIAFTLGSESGQGDGEATITTAGKSVRSSELSASKSSVTEGRSLSASADHPPRLQDTVERPTLSSRERRVGEEDDNYSMRLAFIERFERFEAKANLNDEQRNSVLAIMADMQEQSRLTWESIDDSMKNSIPHDTPHFGDAHRSLRAELLSGLREVLDHDQMVSFRRTAVLGVPFQYGVFLPIEEQKQQNP